jgi:hypothetical protein
MPEREGVANARDAIAKDGEDRVREADRLIFRAPELAKVLPFDKAAQHG